MSNKSLVVPGIFPEIISNGALVVIPAALNTIGVVGTFERGTVNAVTTAGDLAEAQSKLGNWNDSLTGMKALYMALSQNETPIKAVRIGGATILSASRAISDTLTTTLAAAVLANAGATAQFTSTYGVAIGQTWMIGTGAGTREPAIVTQVDPVTNIVTFNANIISAYGLGVTVTLVNAATTLRIAATAGDTVLNVVSTSGFSNGQVIVFGNDALKEEKTIQSMTANTITFATGIANNHLINKAVAGVKVAATVATLTAITPGAFGNQYSVTVAAGAAANTAKVIINGDSKQEIYDNITAANIVDAITGVSTLVTAAAGASLLQPAPADVSLLTGGDNGAITSDGGPAMAGNDRLLYLGVQTGSKTGLYVLDGEQVDIIILAGQSHPSTATALDAYVQGRGDCIAIHGGYLGETVADLIVRASTGGAVSTYPALPVAALNSDRGIVTGPGIVFSNPLTGVPVTLSGAYAAAAYAGTLSAQEPFRSPSHKNIRNILGLEVSFTENDVLNLTLGRVSPITKFKTLGFLIRNGLTSSSDSVFNQISNRRLTDQIIQGLTIIFTPLISEPNNADLAHELKTGADTFLGELSDQGALENYLVNVHASATDKIARQIYVDVNFLQNQAADFIRLRLTPSDTTLSVQANG